MTKQELLEEVLLFFVADCELRPVMNAPFDCNNHVCATDAFTLIRFPRGWMDKPHNPLKGAKAPNVDAVMEQGEFIGSVSAYELNLIGSYVKFGDNYLNPEKYEQIITALKMLGFIRANVYNCSGKVILRNGGFEFLIMKMVVEHPVQEEFVFTPKLSPDVVEDEMDVNTGSLFFEAWKAAEKDLEEADKKARQNNIYDVTIARYYTIQVEAKSCEEAMEIANKYRNEPEPEDFEDAEVYSADRYPSLATPDMKTIYTERGAYTYDEYEEYLDEQEGGEE